MVSTKDEEIESRDLHDHQEQMLEAGGTLWQITERDDSYECSRLRPDGCWEFNGRGQTKFTALVSALFETKGVVVDDVAGKEREDSLSEEEILEELIDYPIGSDFQIPVSGEENE